MNDKLILEFLDLGCPSEKQAYISLQVYLELCEVKKYWDVEYGFNSTLGRMFITAKKTKTCPLDMFLPVGASEELNILKLLEILNKCDHELNSICLVFVNQDTSCVYYQITNGLKEPEEDSGKCSRDNKQEKIDADLHKNRTLLEQSALYGIPITINKQRR